MAKKYQPGDNPLPPDDITAQMYTIAAEKLREAGYIHYEISNYAQEGYQCRHNQVYWHNQPYYGFGMGAASYYNQQRFTRPRTRKEYFHWVQNFKQRGGELEIEKVSATDQLLETLMLGLRLKEGVNLGDISKQFGEAITTKILESLSAFFKQNLIQYDAKNQQLQLTDPDGFLYSNTVLTALFTDLQD